MSVENKEHTGQQQQPAVVTPLPVVRTLDFSGNKVLRQVSTMLRRIWLVDPPLTDEELADPKTVQDCLQSLTQTIGNEIADDHISSSSSSSSEGKKEEEEEEEREKKKWDHALWQTHTQLRLLPPPVVVADADMSDLKSVVSPWREEIYDVYRHLFADLWRLLRGLPGMDGEGEENDKNIGVFEPSRGDSVSLATLPAVIREKGEKREDKTVFRTDTFLYPVWVNPVAKVTFSSVAVADDDDVPSGEEGKGRRKEDVHRWVADESATWTTGLWVKGGQEITITTEMVDFVSDKTGLAAVFVTGHCDERHA